MDNRLILRSLRSCIECIDAKEVSKTKSVSVNGSFISGCDVTKPVKMS